MYAIVPLFAALLPVFAQASSQLPAVPIESLPAAARESVSRVHREVVAHPNNLERVGALARTLHAWELWDAAHQTYARLQQLDPKSFDWRYLDGVVLHRLGLYAEAA
jgi:hypothetical protein